MTSYHPAHARRAALAVLTLATLFLTLPQDALSAHREFAPGDVLVSLHTGEVQWWHSDGSFNAILAGTVPGKAEGMAFDASLNLYVTHHCADGTCRTGNDIEVFNSAGIPVRTFGNHYDCNPTSIVWDADGSVYVGQSDCNTDILKFNHNGEFQGSFDAAVERRGTNWIDMANDGCTLVYTSHGPNVMQYSVCGQAQMAQFNASTMPSGESHAVKVLPDGGLLVATTLEITRLDASGHLVRTYDVAGEPDLWLALDLVGDGTFWAANYGSSSVFRFDLATGDVLASFNTGSPSLTVKGVAVVRTPSQVAKGRMTGGGSIFTDAGMRVTHGFELHCDANDEPNNLQVNWGPGDRFHLLDLTFAECSDDPAISPRPPTAPFDTYRGTGTGRYNGVDGATAEWVLTDAGEPGKRDTWSMTITDAGGNVVLTFPAKRLTFGNHQAHK